MVSIYRKMEQCKCGCRGLCTYFPIDECVRHDFESSDAGCWSDLRYDKSTWEMGARYERRGKRMPLVLACTEIRADWPGFTGPVGMRGCGHAIKPCPVCTCTQAQMYSINEVTLDGGLWPDFDNAAYVASVLRYKRVVRISNQADIRMVVASPLKWDGSKEGLWVALLVMSVP